MKQLILVLSLMVANQAFAYGPIVESVSQLTFIQADCDVCSGGKMVTSTTFKVNYNSCAALPADSFDVEVQAIPLGISGETTNTVAIKLPELLKDCHGPSYSRTYSVSTNDLDENEVYILLNSSVLKADS